MCIHNNCANALSCLNKILLLQKQKKPIGNGNIKIVFAILIPGFGSAAAVTSSNTAAFDKLPIDAVVNRQFYLLQIELKATRTHPVSLLIIKQYDV